MVDLRILPKIGWLCRICWVSKKRQQPGRRGSDDLVLDTNGKVECWSVRGVGGSLLTHPVREAEASEYVAMVQIVTRYAERGDHAGRYDGFVGHPTCNETQRVLLYSRIHGHKEKKCPASSSKSSVYPWGKSSPSLDLPDRKRMGNRCLHPTKRHWKVRTLGLWPRSYLGMLAHDLAAQDFAAAASAAQCNRDG
jgi:hypothetical protein